MLTWNQKHLAPALLVVALVLAVGAVTDGDGDARPLTLGAAIVAMLALIAADSTGRRRGR